MAHLNEGDGGIKKIIYIMSKETPKPCGCGQTKDANGNCDGSHQNIKK